MTILALEFSSGQRSVACARDGVVLAEARETGGRSTRAMTLMQQVLDKAGVSRGQIEGVVVGLGPGSYTGIRTAIAVAEGWHLVKATGFCGVSSVQCLAAQARTEQIFGHIDLVIDAQRGEIYHSRWEVSAGGIRELTPLKIIPAGQIQSDLAGAELIAGPEVTRWFGQGKTLFPTAAALCGLAGSAEYFSTSNILEPIYLRETSFVKAPPSRTY